MERSTVPYIIFLISLYSISCSSQINNSLKNDSLDLLFVNHIQSINDSINKYAITDTTKIYISGSDKEFLEMVEFILDLRIEKQGYTHQPRINRNEIRNIEIWYKKNKGRINKTKINNYYYLMKRVYDAYNDSKPEDFLNDDNKVHRVFEQLDSLKHIRTYLD